MSVSSPAICGPVLENGDRLNRDEFHRLYEQTAEEFSAELIGGVVYVSSPLRRRHGAQHVALSGLLFVNQASTPGVEAGNNATILLGDDSEPQPDLYLRILPESGGNSRTSDDDYIVGPPELIIEVAHSCRAIDLNSKFDDYARHGVREYLVVCLAEEQMRWLTCRMGMRSSPTPMAFTEFAHSPVCGLIAPRCLPMTTPGCSRPHKAVWHRPSMRSLFVGWKSIDCRRVRSARRVRSLRCWSCREVPASRS